MIKSLLQTILAHRWLILSALLAYATAVGLVQYQSMEQAKMLSKFQHTAERIKFKLQLVGIK